MADKDGFTARMRQEGSMFLQIMSVAEMRAVDSRSAALGVPTRLLMERAGAAVARAVASRFEPRPVAVLCGPGNNGGDGWVAARLLAEWGWPVWVETLVEPAALSGDAAEAAAAFQGRIAPLSAEEGAKRLTIDALFGAGLTRPLDGIAAQRAAALDPSRTVAVDVPSGLPGDGDAPNGAHARAGLTVTFVAKKLAHVLEPGRGLCGDIVVADIGAPEAALAEIKGQVWENGPALWADALPWPARAAHKHGRGHAMAVSGPATRTGAARLSARAALRAGAGLVTVLSPRDALAINAAHLTAIMLAEAEDAEAIAQAGRAADAIVIGPAAGVATRTREAALRLLAQEAPVILDADALTVFQDDPAALFAALRATDVMTPHVGEFRRLFPDLDESFLKTDRARLAAARAGCVVLLKGPDTVIAAPDGRCVVNATGSPFLATAGSGDVLAGIIAGVIAQGMASFEASCAAAWLHGAAGQGFGPGLIAEDLPEALPALLDSLAPIALRRR